MNVSPLDLRQQRFRTSFRGFDKVEVTSLLSAAADDYEHALKETDKLKQEVARLEGMLREQRDQEASLKAMLLTATKIGEDIKTTAEEEAKRILREAHGRSDLLLEKTQSRLEDVQRETDGLRLKRRDVEASIESTIQALRNALDYVREQEARDREEKILLHRPRFTAELESRVAELQEARK